MAEYNINVIKNKENSLKMILYTMFNFIKNNLIDIYTIMILYIFTKVVLILSKKDHKLNYTRILLFLLFISLLFYTVEFNSELKNTIKQLLGV